MHLQGIDGAYPPAEFAPDPEKEFDLPDLYLSGYQFTGKGHATTGEFSPSPGNKPSL
jgi:hypothetical protein